MQALKFAVIGMGVLIVLGLALLAFGLVSRVATDDAAAPGFNDLVLGLPAGCAIAEARGHEGRLILRAEGPEERGCQQVFLIDMASGKILGRIHARAGGAQSQ